jgi:hypothetical protein
VAYATIETKILNPAGRRTNGGKKVARHMTAKQIRFFGTKRQKAALRGKRRHNAAPKRNAARRNPSPKRNPPKRNSARHHHKRRRNPIPEIISLTMGNPAKRSNMAATKKNRAHKRRRRNPAASRRNAGARPSYKRNTGHHHRRRRRNPGGIEGLGEPMQWIKGGVGVIGGAVGARVLPQLAGSANTGAVGYAMNFGATLLMGFAAHMIAKDPVITASVIAGGMAGTLVRIATDNTTYGSYLALSGVGDYVVWNYSQPQRVTGPNASMIDTSWRMAAAAAQSPMIAGSLDKFRG